MADSTADPASPLLADEPPATPPATPPASLGLLESLPSAANLLSALSSSDDAPAEDDNKSESLESGTAGMSLAEMNDIISALSEGEGDAGNDTEEEEEWAAWQENEATDVKPIAAEATKVDTPAPAPDPPIVEEKPVAQSNPESPPPPANDDGRFDVFTGELKPMYQLSNRMDEIERRVVDLESTRSVQVSDPPEWGGTAYHNSTDTLVNLM